MLKPYGLETGTDALNGERCKEPVRFRVARCDRLKIQDICREYADCAHPERVRPVRVARGKPRSAAAVRESGNPRGCDREPFARSRVPPDADAAWPPRPSAPAHAESGPRAKSGAPRPYPTGLPTTRESPR